MNNTRKDNLSLVDILTLDKNCKTAEHPTNIVNAVNDYGIVNQTDKIYLYSKTTEIDHHVRGLLSNLYPKTRYRSLTDSSPTSSVFSTQGSTQGSCLSLSSFGEEAANVASSNRDYNNWNEIINKTLNTVDISEDANARTANILVDNINYQHYQPNYLQLEHQLDLFESHLGFPKKVLQTDTIPDDNEISKSLRMFALHSLYDDSKVEKLGTDYELLKARSNLDDVMKEFNSNGFTTDVPLIQNGGNDISGSDLYRLYQQQQQYNRLTDTPEVGWLKMENAALLYHHQQQQQQHLTLLQQVCPIQTEIKLVQYTDANNKVNDPTSSFGNEPLADSCVVGTTEASSIQAQIPTVISGSENNAINTESSENILSPTILQPLNSYGSGSISRPTFLTRDIPKSSSATIDESTLVSSKFESYRTTAIKLAKRYNVLPKHCVFCENNNEPEALVKSHTVRDKLGRVLCPKLRTYVCPICYDSGDNAHTVKYCPKKPIVTMEDVLKAGNMRANKGAFYKQRMKV